MASGLLDKANIILTPTGYKAGTMYNVAPIEQPYEDFVFSRASVASRVNSSGLVEMVGRTLGSNLVQNGDFSEIGPDLVQNGTFELGSELVTSTSSTDNWINARGNSVLSVEGDTVRVTIGSGSTFGISTAITTVIGKSYQINSTGVRSNSSGSFIMRVANSANLSPAIYQDATLDDLTLTTSASFTATATTTYVGFLATLQSTGDYIETNSLSVKEVLDWSLGGAATIENDALHLESATNEYSYARQDISSLAAKTYKIQLEIKNYVSGACQVGFTGSSPNLQNLNVTSDGTYTAYLSPNANGNDLEISREFGGGNFNFDVDNVVVQELDPNDYWTLGAGWSIGDDALVGNGTMTASDTANQAYDFTDGNTYKFTFEITESTQGTVFIREPFNGGAFATGEVGTHTIYGVAGAANELRLRSSDSFIGKITNIVVQEVIDTNNIPRINYDSNGENGHWLLEPTSTNLVTYSEDFSQWTLGSNSTLTYESDVVAPDGSLGVYRLTNPATSSTYIQSPLFTYNNPITLSIYAKYADASNNEFDLYDGTNTTRKITTSEWQRFDAVGFGNQLTIVNSGDTYITDIYIWGAQAEALSYATSYIPTLTGSTETRATETATGAGSADLINSTEGVLYGEIAVLEGQTNINRYITINNGTDDNFVSVHFRNNTNNQIRAIVRVSNSNKCDFTYNPSGSTSFAKFALKWKANDFALWVNGVEIGSDTSGSTFSANTLNNISFDSGQGSDDFYGKCKALAVFNTALTDAELTELTS